MTIRAADIGAYFVLNHGSVDVTSPTPSHRIHDRSLPAPTVRVNATATASAAGISG